METFVPASKFPLETTGYTPSMRGMNYLKIRGYTLVLPENTLKLRELSRFHLDILSIREHLSF